MQSSLYSQLNRKPWPQSNRKPPGSCVPMTPAIECRSIVAINTLIDPRSTCRSPLGRHVNRYIIDTWPTSGNSRSSVNQLNAYHFRDTENKLAPPRTTTHWLFKEKFFIQWRSVVEQLSPRTMASYFLKWF